MQSFEDTTEDGLGFIWMVSVQANARSQFSIAVSCEGAVPAASCHRDASNGGESVESVADPAEGLPLLVTLSSCIDLNAREPIDCGMTCIQVI